MKITTRFMINFVLLVAGILLIFSLIIIVFYSTYRNKDFSIRLINKATNSATLVIQCKRNNHSIIKNY